ncbi:hypothetical protein OHA25_08535 [Nonomuraea sp. NBC_00507]|uniref:hypothetical protein n=1 Tax=Nonomuraea sp. NBC_00507 TaxID=2976002 RepID=UPI002E175589
MPYAEAAELGVLMGRGDAGLDAAETARAELLLQLATGVIDDETGQSLTMATDTVTLDGSGRHRLLLPRWPVTAVATVTVLEDDDSETDLVHGVDYRWTSYGRLRRIRGCWPCREQAVDVTYTAGYDPIPDGVKAMCLRLARAGWENGAGKESERLGDWAAKWATPGMLPTTGELRTLSIYRART